MPYITTAEQVSLFYTDYPGRDPVVFADAWGADRGHVELPAAGPDGGGPALHHL